jgi:hypothetical protein
VEPLYSGRFGNWEDVGLLYRALHSLEVALLYKLEICRFVIERFTQFRGCFTVQPVVERFLLCGESVIRGSTVYSL